MTAPFEAEATPPVQYHELDPIEQEKNPLGWNIIESETDEATIVKGQEKSTGDLYQAKISAVYNETIVQVLMAIENNTSGAIDFFDATYRWANKTDIDDSLFYRERSDTIAFWCIERRIPKEFVRCAWRRSRERFNTALCNASIYALEVRAENEKKKQDDKRDLFSS